MQKYTNFENQNETENLDWKNGLETSAWPFLVTNKLSVEISQFDSEETISNYLKNGILNFGLDLFLGSVEQNLKVIELLQESVRKESQLLNCSIPISVYLKLSPRLPHTGNFKRTKNSVQLKLHSQVVLTTNREYASKSCHSFIYVNAKILIRHIKKCDIVCLGEDVQLQVVDAQLEQAVCKVIVAGLVTPRMNVRFPNAIQEAYKSELSTEELEDITFAVGTHVNVVVTYGPGSPEDYNQLRGALAEFKCSNYYLFTRCTQQSLENCKDTEWLASAYDGFLFDFAKPLQKNGVVRLSEKARICMNSGYDKRKPMFVQGSWSSCVHPEDYQYAFYFPDKYILPCRQIYLRLFEAVFNNITCTQFVTTKTNEKQCDRGLARSIVAASIDFQADAIVVCTTQNAKLSEIAHNRPKSTIICVASLDNFSNFYSMHHNIWMLSYELIAENEVPVSPKEGINQKLVFGVQFGLLKELLDHSSTVVLVFEDSFAVVRIDEQFPETIKNVIFSKKTSALKCNV